MQCDYGFLLIEPEEAQTVSVDEAGAFDFIPPGGLGSIARALRENNVVVAHQLFNKTLEIWNGFLVTHHGRGCREGCDEVWVAALKIPEVMQVAVGENDEAAVLRPRIFARLLFTNKRVFVF